VGTDDLFKKRKARTAQDQARRKASRAPYEKVLIVCEGEKTEPNYFNELIDFYEINTANVVIDGSCGSSPISVVNHAIARYAKEKDTLVPYDKVYCVIDRDTHESFDEAIAKLAKQKPAGVFHAAVSVPCFEYWLLLHFHYTTAAFMAAGGKSAGDRAEAALKEYWPTYHKGTQGAFGHVLKDIEFAKANAARSLADARQTGSSNPSTNVHELVEYLQNIKVAAQ
jgi:archaellin